MSTYTDVVSQTANYKGIIGWNGYTETLNSYVRQAVEIELFVKEHSIPIRAPKVTDINTVPMLDPMTQRSMNVNVVLFGSPELLQVTLSGHVKTPITNGVYAPKAKDGTALPMAGLSYVDIINMYIEGQLNQSSGGGWQRKDPDYFISPYGNRYDHPIIAIFEPSFTATPKEQGFSMTLYLET